MANAVLDSTPLRGSDGDLVSILISVDPWRLEDLLDALASGISFPVNPEIRHLNHAAQVEFPAYSNRVTEVRRAVTGKGFSAGIVEVLNVPY